MTMIRWILRCSTVSSLLLFLLLLPSLCDARASPTPPPTAGSKSSLTTATHNNVTATSTNITSQKVVQLVETETWDGSKWQAVGWMDATRENVVDSSPDETPLPSNGLKWTSVWKIAVGNSKDGWQYSWRRPHQGIRERTWLRTYEVKPPTTISAKGQKSKKKRAAATESKSSSSEVWLDEDGPYFKMPAWMKAVRDDFNFKGLGWSFYKSLLSLKSFGVALRIPVTANFEIFDRNPDFPSNSCSISLYSFPLMIAFSWSVSLRLEVLQWSSRRLLEKCTAALLWIVWVTLLRNLGMCYSVLSFPLTRDWKPMALMPEYIVNLWRNGAVERPQYRRTLEERLGWSVSWRLSRGVGYQFRVSYWHFVAPTLTSLWQESLPGRLLLKSREPPNWFRRRNAGIGLSTGIPTPTPPHVFSSIVMSLSGYYFKGAPRSKKEPTLLASRWGLFPMFGNKKEPVKQKLSGTKKIVEEDETEEDEVGATEGDLAHGDVVA